MKRGGSELSFNAKLRLIKDLSFNVKLHFVKDLIYDLSDESEEMGDGEIVRRLMSINHTLDKILHYYEG